jgi:hypothetical protein
MAIFGQQFALSAPRTRRAELQAADEVPPPGSKAEISLANILLLIPGDIVTIYMTGKSIGTGTTVVAAAALPPFVAHNWVLIAFITCAIACFLFRLQATKPPVAGSSWRDANWSLAFWTTVAFVLWAHAVSEVGPLIPWFTGGFAAFFAGLFGVFAPRLVRADALAP